MTRRGRRRRQLACSQLGSSGGLPTSDPPPSRHRRGGTRRGGVRPRVRSARGAGRGGREARALPRRRRPGTPQAAGPPRRVTPSPPGFHFPDRRGGAGPGGFPSLVPPARSRFASPARELYVLPVLARFLSPPEVTPPGWGPLLTFVSIPLVPPDPHPLFKIRGAAGRDGVWGPL